MTPDAWRDAGDWFEWRGHRIWCRTAGTGEPLVLIHGFPTASWDWHMVWPALAERFRLVTLDMIGFGFSAKPRDFAYTVASQADLFEALLARESIGAYRILSHDFGVTVTQELLARRRGRIAAVCFLNGGLFPETHRPLIGQRLLASPVGKIVARVAGYRAFAASMRQIWGTRKRVTDDELRAMWQLVSANDGTRVMPQLIGYMAERRRLRTRFVGAIVDSDVPLRLVNGLLDPVSGAHMVARYRELVARPDVVELADVGHYPQVEAADAVVSASADFLATAAPPLR
jgi:pimeloyl-ACP methyl ester carboxylesterase